MASIETHSVNQILEGVKRLRADRDGLQGKVRRWRAATVLSTALALALAFALAVVLYG